MKRFAALALASAFFIALSGLPARAQDTAAASDDQAVNEDQAAQAAPAPVVLTTAQLAQSLKSYIEATKSCYDALTAAVQLSSQGKWKSAYVALDGFDKDNLDPFALAMKTSLMLKGAVRTDMHRSFGLTDLEAGQDLDTLRNNPGDYEPIAFDPPALAEAQETKGVTAPGILLKVMGDYYYDVLSRFSGQWAIADDQILAKIVENYSKAYTLGIFDLASLLNYADSLVKSDRADDSDTIFRKAIGLDSKDAHTRYSYAVSLAYRGKRAESLYETDKAIEYYGDSSAKVNAIALGAKTAEELGDDSKAQEYFALADKDYPQNPTPGILRHLVAIETNNAEAAMAAAADLIAAYGSNPSVVRTLVSTWYAAGQAETAKDFLTGSIAKGGDDMTIGNMDFYLAVLLSQETPSDADRAIALMALDQAEAHFKVALGEDNDVYGVIAQIRDNLQPVQTGEESKETGAVPEAGQTPDAVQTPDAAQTPDAVQTPDSIAQ